MSKTFKPFDALTPKVEVIYSCKACGVMDAAVKVRAREAGEGIADWLMTLAEDLGADHSRRSPRCRSTHVDEVKVPVPPADGAHLGEATKQ